MRHLVENLPSNYPSEKRYCYTKSSHIVPQIPLSTYFDGLPFKGSTDNGFQWSGLNTFSTSSQFSQLAYNMDLDASNSSSSTKSELSGFVESLQNVYKLAGVTDVEKMEILAVVDLLNEFDSKHSASVYENLDEPGRRYFRNLIYCISVCCLSFYNKY